MKWLVLAVLAVLASPAWSQQTVVATCGTAAYTAGSTANQTQDTNGQTCS
jgi:hypothetical protein